MKYAQLVVGPAGSGKVRSFEDFGVLILPETERQRCSYFSFDPDLYRSNSLILVNLLLNNSTTLREYSAYCFCC